MEVFDVAEAAEALDVSPRRVRGLLASGQLAGEQIGRNWAVDRASVDHFRRNEVGRPWSPSSAWAVLNVAAGNGGALSPLGRSRARQRLAERGLAELVGRLRSRAERHHAYAHPSALVRIVDDVRSVRGGVSAAPDHGVDLIVSDEAEIYMRASDALNVADDYALDEGSDRPNVIMHVVDDDVWPFDEGVRVAPWPVVAVDLLDANDERSRRAGLELAERSR